MQIENNRHLTYCTNIHPGESWEEVFDYLKKFTLSVRNKLSPEKPFGIGLRLSNVAAEGILEVSNLEKFKHWLQEKNMYVFTINGFPYGGFHQKSVKDLVHQPDWGTSDRLLYTKRLIHILAELLPENMEGSISTSPLTYKPWFGAKPEKLEEVVRTSCLNLAAAVEEMHNTEQKTGKFIHLDIEPEPDGYLENTDDVIQFFNNYLLPIGSGYLTRSLHKSPGEAEDLLRKYLQTCYDVCHIALAYEAPDMAFAKLEKAGIKVGKIQISAALKADMGNDPGERKKLAEAFSAFDEPTYLHQVVAKQGDGSLKHYYDLPDALAHVDDQEVVEWRTHFHVPIFLKDYARLQSTQEDILAVFEVLKDKKWGHHLEIETYTWDVLPENLKINVVDSIVREYGWVVENLK